MHYCKTKQNLTIRSQLYWIVLDATSKQTHTYVTNANDTDIKCVRESSKHQCHQFRNAYIIVGSRSHGDLCVAICIFSCCASTFDQTETATELHHENTDLGILFVYFFHHSAASNQASSPRSIHLHDRSHGFEFIFVCGTFVA